MEKPMSRYGKVVIHKKDSTKKNIKIYKCDLEDMKVKSILIQLSIFCFGWLYGAVSIFGNFNPLGIACIAAFLGREMKFYTVLLAVFLGYMSNNIFRVEIYVIAICICIAAETFPFFGKLTLLKYKGIIGGVGIFIGVMGGLLIDGLSTFVVVRGLIEAVCVIGFCEIMKKSLVLFDGGINKKILNEDDIVCLGTIGIVSVSSLCAMGKAGLYTGIILGTCFILICAFKAGTQAVAVGVIVGLFLMLLQVITKEVFIIISVAVLMAGVFNKKKIYTIVALFLGAIIPSFYLGVLPTFSLLGVSILGSILFLIMPKRFLNSINTYQNHKEEFGNGDYFIKIKELMQIKLNAFAEVFGSLAKTFEIQEFSEKISPKDAIEVIDKVSRNVCESCEMSPYCWEKKEYNTYEGIHYLIGAVNEKGEAETQDFTDWIKENCIKKRELLTFSNMYGREHKNNLIWENRLNNCRKILKEQLICVEQIVKEVTFNSVFQPVFYESFAKEIKKKLEGRNIKVEKTYVAATDKDGFSVSITKDACYGNKQCKTDILPVVSSVLGKRITSLEKECVINETGNCVICYKEQKGYRLKTAVAAVKEKGSETSGDTYYHDEIDEKKGILVLCDGMGTGILAAKESGKAVSLIRSFVKAGFPLDIAIKSLNSVLSVDKREDMYTTMDVCSIDLYSGEAEIIKNGGASVFVIKDEKIKVIRSSSLPMGILKDWQGDATGFRLKRGDIIIMVTDGVTDSFGLDKEEIIISEVIEKKRKNLNELAAEILRIAINENGGSAKDDMTVLIGEIC